MDLSGADVSHAIFRNADLSSARLRAIRGYPTADWIGIEMIDASFAGAYILRREIMDQNFLYEFRQKSSPYNLGLGPLIGDEDNWHAFDVAYIISKHATLVAGGGNFGTLANADADSTWWLQLKYEF